MNTSLPSSVLAMVGYSGLGMDFYVGNLLLSNK